MAIGNKRKLEAISRKMLAGKVDQDIILCDLAECIHDMNCIAEYCEQAEAEINFMCTSEFWQGKEQ